MELPAEVRVHNELLGLKGAAARLLQVSADGYYELRLNFGENQHRVLLPVASTVVIAALPETQTEGVVSEVER
jgi:hypothetical protein